MWQCTKTSIWWKTYIAAWNEYAQKKIHKFVAWNKKQEFHDKSNNKVVKNNNSHDIALTAPKIAH